MGKIAGDIRHVPIVDATIANALAFRRLRCRVVDLEYL
jgi:hypothetical protein